MWKCTHVNFGWQVIALDAIVKTPPSVTSAVAALLGSPTLELMRRARRARRSLGTRRRCRIANVAGHYAVGIVPSTALHDNQAAPTRSLILEPGQSRRLGVTIELLKGAAGANLLDPEAL